MLHSLKSYLSFKPSSLCHHMFTYQNPSNCRATLLPVLDYASFPIPRKTSLLLKFKIVELIGFVGAQSILKLSNGLNHLKML